MTPNKSTVSSAVAAFLLAALTLTTFYVLREYGPESAVQHFHSAAISGNISDLQRFTLQNVNDPSVQKLASIVRSIAEQGGRPEVENVQRGPGRVVVRIAYFAASGAEQDIYWVVD